jgi:hypothetical protein
MEKRHAYRDKELQREESQRKREMDGHIELHTYSEIFTKIAGILTDGETCNVRQRRET